jgi:tRNA(Ile)-lysidine synthase
MMDAFNRHLDPSSTAPIAVALSGGGDSLAALLATKTWADEAGRRVLVLTVDHCLQPQSPDWTAFAQATAQHIGADFEALAWRDDKPATGLAAAARKARHRLIAEAARRRGARVVVFGHTADDRAEAALMRAEGSSVGAPREWSPSPVWPEGRGVFLLRPLLNQRRAAIREALAARGETWIDDPANANLASARVRARARLADEDITAQACLKSDPTLGDLARATTIGAAGELTIDRALFNAAPLATRLRVLGAALVCVGGGDRTPRRERLEALAVRLEAVGDLTATLVGAKVVASGERMLIVRNPGEATRGALAPLDLAPGASAVWDGRFELTSGDHAVRIEPLAGHARAIDPVLARALKAVPTPARGALPSHVGADGRRTCPILAQDGAVRVRSLVAARFLAATGMISKEPAA